MLKLYGFTSDKGGIRHALMDEPSLGYSDAKFMLVLCSPFTNFLWARCAESGVKMYLSRARHSFREHFRALEQGGGATR